MKIKTSLMEQAKIEMRLGKAARGATAAENAKNRQQYINQLFELATHNAWRMEELDRTTDPMKIALGSLVISAYDDRPLFEIPYDEIDPDDAYSQMIKQRQQNFPAAVVMLTEKLRTN